MGSAALLAVTGCGFRPVYGRGSADGGYDVQQDLAAVGIEVIPDREGQVLYNYLLDRFNPRGRPVRPLHSLVASTGVTTRGVGTKLDATTTRAEVTASVEATLRAFEEEFDFLSKAVTSYSTTTESDYASEVARQDAVDWSLRVIADDLRLQIATFFEKRRVTQ